MERTILLADDSSTIQRLVERTFEDSDFRVVSVSNGEAAVRKVEELRPAVVLADIFMPGKNGYEVCAFVKQHASLSGTPVVLLVGAFEAFDENEARRVGADTTVTKPFDPRRLAATVADLMGPQQDDAGPVASSIDASATSDEALKVPVTADMGGNAPVGKRDDVVSGDASSQQESHMTRAAQDSDVHSDILKLKELFPAASTPERPSLTGKEIDAIADRVIQRLSSEVVESIAWDIVPEIADRIMRDESKRSKDES